ncbi:metal-dependent phosphohydrolase [Chryseobacterium sp. IHB B 17019]|uniref:HD domain-containing protein n=1 Tax=Chryseobacterium sp. IHB B 17019 TaxID=1721091 RepID=UPI00072170FD|nr:HD domain-containing protein [Chryseobacterium sp. IHB B 17019]ALR30104.1 metal-dependent phosphohydrolase [Chryseobacterium sp. IHB B 17019]
MDRSEIIDKIIEFADQAHGDQTRKYSPDRYIVHPIRVMKTCSEYTDSLPILAAAVLHDVLEDTPYIQDDISAFLESYMNEAERNLTISLVIELTDVYVKENFPKLNRFKRKRKEIKRLKNISPEAQTIKYADILDNAAEISQNDPMFAERYLKECLDILLALKDGNSQLRQTAIDLVTTEQKKIKSEL